MHLSTDKFYRTELGNIVGPAYFDASLQCWCIGALMYDERGEPLNEGRPHERLIESVEAREVSEYLVNRDIDHAFEFGIVVAENERLQEILVDLEGSPVERDEDKFQDATGHAH